MANGDLTQVQGPGQIEARVIPGEGMAIFLRGIVDVRLAGELEQVMRTAQSYPPVTVDLSGTVSLDHSIVDILAEASASFPDGLRVVGAVGTHPTTFDFDQVEHLRV